MRQRLRLPPWLTAGRLWDALALLVIVFVGYRLLIAPRSLQASAAYPAPHVTYATLSGPPFELTRARGRVVFLDFFASWCGPCKLSLPLVEAFARAHPQADVVPVDVGEPRAVAQAFARSYHLRHVALDPHTSSAAFFAVRGFPTMVVIDPQGRIRATWVGFNPAIELNMANAEKTLATTPAPTAH